MTIWKKVETTSEKWLKDIWKKGDSDFERTVDNEVLYLYARSCTTIKGVIWPWTCKSNLLIIGVTVLTSLDQKDLSDIGVFNNFNGYIFILKNVTVEKIISFSY